MDMESYQQAVDSIRRENGVEGAMVFSLKGEMIYENLGDGEWSSLVNKVKSIIGLTNESKVDSQELIIVQQSTKVHLSFFKDSVLSVFCHEKISNTVLNIALKMAGKKLNSTRVSLNRRPTTKSKNSKLDRLITTVELNRNTEHALSVMLKKVVCEMEGPMGSIIFKKALRQCKLKADDINKDNAPILISNLSGNLGDSAQFQNKAEKLVKEFFG